MRLLLVHNRSLDLNGEDIYFESLIELLKKHNNQTFLYAKSNKNLRNDFFENVSVARNMFENEKSKIKLSKIIGKVQPDIAHFHNVYPLISPSAYSVCKQYRVPIIQTIHNYRFMCSKAVLFRNGKVCELCVRKKFPYYSILYGCYHRSRMASAVFASAFFYHKHIKKSFDAIDTYIFPSPFTRDYYVKNLQLSPSKTVVLPYFVPLNKKRRDNRKKDYFLFAGRLSEEKGVLQLLEVFKALPYKLVVIGDGPLKKQVLKYKNYENIEIKHFLPQNKIFFYMQNAICTIIPSLWYEVLPMVMLESFANGTPVIVPEFGTFKNTVIKGKTGFFYEQNNWEDLRVTILKVYEKREKLSGIRENCRKEHEEKYTQEKHYKALLQVYKSLLK